MSSSRSFDDQFNDGVFRTSLHTSKLTRPDEFPLSTSEMRKHVVYERQGTHPMNETWHSTFVLSRPGSNGAYPKFSRRPWNWKDSL